MTKQLHATQPPMQPLAKMQPLQLLDVAPTLYQILNTAETQDYGFHTVYTTATLQTACYKGFFLAGDCIFAS